MNTVYSQSLIEEARNAMHGRMLRCPLEENPEDCPLHEIRKWPMEERIAWLDSKSDIEVLQLYHEHTNCLMYKLSVRNEDAE